MPSSWKLPSTPPHDFTLCLDIDSYFDFEHQPERIFEEGFTRSLPLASGDILVTILFNGEPDSPEFLIRSQETLSDEQQQEANRYLNRILGTEIDLNPLYEQASADPVLSPLFEEFYGFKRLSRATFFEDAVNRIIRMQIKHKPTARRMVHDFRAAYSTRFDYKGSMIPAWPWPERVETGDPEKMKQYGLSKRKGEYLVELSGLITSGKLNDHELESYPPGRFYETATGIRGIGPIAAQDLMLFRNRTDAVFPSHWQKGMEKGLRRWIILSYGGDPEHTTEDEFREMIQNWRDYEAVAVEYLYAHYIMAYKRQKEAT